MSGSSVPIWSPLLGFGWIGVIVGFSVLMRRRQGKPIFPKAPPHALFAERGCSGRSLDTPWGRIGGARNCLLLTLTPSELVISPTFPFNLAFLPELYGLDHNVDIRSINAVTVRRGILGRKIIVQYSTRRHTRRVELRLSRSDRFLALLEELGAPLTIA